jgi:PST family polysaccharide transporter
VLIARALGPAQFGVLAVLAAAAGIVGVIADLGLSTTAVKRVAAIWPEQAAAASHRWQAYVVLRVVTCSLVILIPILLAEPIATRLLRLDEPDSAGLLRLALLGVLATALSGAFNVALQATRRFGRLSLALFFNSALTVLLALLLAWAGLLNLVTVLLILGICTSLATMALSYGLLPAGWGLQRGALERASLRAEGAQLLGFGRWLWIGGIFAVLAAQLDVLLLNRSAPAVVVGAYALALNLAGKADLVNQSLHAVLLPAASALEAVGDVRGYVRRGLKRSALISLALLPLFPLAGPLIVLFYGAEYVVAAPLFRALLLVVIFDILTMPLLLLAFPLNRPRLLAAADAVRAATLALAGLALIPALGAWGAVAARAAARVAGAALILVALLRRAAIGDR